MSEDNLFIRASKQKLRFATNKGQLSTEDLWDLSLEDLDRLAVKANSAKETSTMTFIRKRDAKATENNLRFDILKFIIDSKLNDQDVAAKRAETIARKELLKGLLEKKKLEDLSNLSADEIQKKIEELTN